MDEASQQSHPESTHFRVTNISPHYLLDTMYGNGMRPHPFSSGFIPEVRYPAPHLRHTLPFRGNMPNLPRELFLQNNVICHSFFIFGIS